MTENPHNPPDNSGGNSLQNNPRSSGGNAPAKRKQRIRGCGVPASVWFAPHPETRTTEAAPDTDPLLEQRDWALEETVRQFTSVGQHYGVIRVPAPDAIDDPVLTGTITRHRRTADEADAAGDADADASIVVGFDLVVITASNAEEFDYAVDRAERDWRAMPDGMTLAALIKGAKRTLGDGGILALRLPRPRPGHGFRDETGTVIAEARRSGLAYLQHIALVDAFIDHEGITPALPKADLDAFHSARTAGLPVHARSHSDLLIFRKPGKADLLD
jgi:hypothetical protein